MKIKSDAPAVAERLSERPVHMLLQRDEVAMALAAHDGQEEQGQVHVVHCLFLCCSVQPSWRPAAHAAAAIC